MDFVVLADFLSSNRADVDLKRVQQAYTMAERIHAGQKRLDGRPYVTHPISVAFTMAQAGADEDIICAALLHDVLEDGDNKVNTSHEILAKFGAHVLFLVDAMSKDHTIGCSHLRQQEFFAQLEQALTLDTGLFFLKFADLLHNLESIEQLKPEKKLKWMNELQHGYLPMLTGFHSQLSYHHHDTYQYLMDQIVDLAAHKTSQPA